MLRYYFILFCTISIYFSCLLNENSFFISDISAQVSPTIELERNDTAICPNDTIYLNIDISGQLPIHVIYETTISGIKVRKTIYSFSKPLKFEIYRPGAYEIVKYANNNSFVDTSIWLIARQTFAPSAELTGGGSFCENEPVIPIGVTFTGFGPWTLTYQYNFGNAVTQVFNQNEVELLNSSGNINIRSVKDLHCSTKLFDTSSIHLFEAPIVQISGIDEICVSESAYYSTYYKGNYKYSWFVPKEASTNIGEDFHAYTLPIIWNTPGLYKLGLIVEIQNTGCSSNRIEYPVRVYDLPDVLQDFDTVLCFDKENLLRINPAKNAENTVYWPHLGDTIQEIDIYEPGTYTYVERIPFGCMAIGNFRLIDKCIPEIYVAEAFSPNGDGINDLLEIKGVFYNLFISFYTSTGELVYTKAPNSPNWDGTMKGVSMPIGDYYWKATFTDKFGEQYTNEGWVTLIR